MKTEREELMEVVGELAARYTSYESTSLTYEKAEQLAEAVLYCVREAEEAEDTMPADSRPSLRQRYEIGAARVEEKTKKALCLYNDLMTEFSGYGNRCLQDTVAGGLPEFFRRYDAQYEPQNTILTLDYPVLRDLSGYTGIDRIDAFIRCICLEQAFLKQFPEKYITAVLSRYNSCYQDMIDNLCEIVLTSVIAHALAEKPLSEETFSEEECARIRDRLAYADLSEMTAQWGRAKNAELAAYLQTAVREVLVRLQNAAENVTIHLQR